MPYHNLKADLLGKQIDQLRRRIEERFPDRNLGLVCDEIRRQASEAQQRADWIARPILSVRAGVLLLVVLLVSILVYFAQSHVEVDNNQFGFGEFVTLLEAGINAIVLIGAGIFFLVTAELRLKRRRTLAALHELRALAHVVDMHQLTKDPELIIGRDRSTPSSPKVSMTLFELVRYLDYCSEMLSLIGKIAAIYVQDFDDEVAIDAVNDVESLTTGLSRKIWQKIMYVQSVEEQQLLRQGNNGG